MTYRQKKWQKQSLFSTPQVKASPPKRSFLKRIAGFLGKSLKRLCTALGAMILLSFLLSTLFFATISTPSAPVKLPSEMVLYYRLDGRIKEENMKPSLMDPFPVREVTMPQLVRTLNALESDDRVKGIIVSLHGQPLSLSYIQEFRQAIKDLKRSGKFAYVIAADYSTGGMGQYYLASVFDRIWMHPVGVVGMTGISMETPYIKKLLDKVGVTPQFFQRKEFKSAFESFTAEKMSDSNRQAMQSVVNELGTQITQGIAQERNVPPEEVKGWMKTPLIPAKQAISKNLIDSLGYGDDLLNYIKEKEGERDLKIVNFSTYVGRAMAQKRGTEEIAYIHVGGTLTLAPDAYGDYGDEALLTSGSEVAAAIQDAAHQDYIRAIVLRVDSPGGTPAAAEVIRHAVVKAQEAGKIVYISMAGVAASGGYWLSADADQIFALPGTLTGSIGVVGGKVTIQELIKKLDVRFETVRYGDNAGFWSMAEPFNADQIKSFESMLDATYDSFITRVAQGRGLTLEEAESSAKGRVWTGTQALERKLVDGLGGLGITLDILAKDLGHKDQSDLALVQFPRPKPRYEEILEFIEQQAVFMGVMAQFQPVLENISLYFNSHLNSQGMMTHMGVEGI